MSHQQLAQRNEAHQKIDELWRALAHDLLIFAYAGDYTVNAAGKSLGT